MTKIRQRVLMKLPLWRMRKNLVVARQPDQVQPLGDEMEYSGNTNSDSPTPLRKDSEDLLTVNGNTEKDTNCQNGNGIWLSHINL